jgi:hypothetical protein
MALTALNLALPAIASLMAGTGAMTAYVAGPTTAPAAISAPEVAAPKPKSCEAQTWPYIDNRCVATNAQQNREVRFVMAPRGGVYAALEDLTQTPATTPKMDAPAPAAPGQLVTRDTVARSVETAPPVAMPQVSRRAEKRRVGEERKLVRQAYQVPSETKGRRDQRPVIVVRPLRLDIFR